MGDGAAGRQVADRNGRVAHSIQPRPGAKAVLVGRTATESNAKTQRRKDAEAQGKPNTLCVSAPLRLCVRICRDEINGSGATPKTATGTGTLPHSNPVGDDVSL